MCTEGCVRCETKSAEGERDVCRGMCVVREEECRGMCEVGGKECGRMCEVGGKECRRMCEEGCVQKEGG